MAAEIRRIPAQGEAIPNQYIVVFKQGVTSQARATHRAWAAERHFSVLSLHGSGLGTVGLISKFNVCDGELCGYSAAIPAHLAEEINNTDEVDFVEPDYKVYALGQVVSQTNAGSWGLARLSSPTKLTPENDSEYLYDETAGEGTTAYVIDTGILAEHEEFEGRATFGFNAVRNSSDTDRNGHGTHVSGTIGSKTYGVAKKTKLIGVKVLGDDGSGSNSGVIAGIQWAVKDAREKGVTKCVANMSLGGGVNKALNRAVKLAVNAGVTFVCASGNEGSDASTSSPGSEPTVITVGATSKDDTCPDWSNYGPLVDIHAPGDYIVSTYIDESGNGSVTETSTLRGTSMASPHVCGLAAYLMAQDPTLNTPKKVTARIKELGLKGQIDPSSLQGNTVNLLAHNGAVPPASQ